MELNVEPLDVIDSLFEKIASLEKQVGFLNDKLSLPGKKIDVVKTSYSTEKERIKYCIETALNHHENLKDQCCNSCEYFKPTTGFGGLSDGECTNGATNIDKTFGAVWCRAYKFKVPVGDRIQAELPVHPKVNIGPIGDGLYTMICDKAK